MRPEHYAQTQYRRIWVDEQPFSLPVAGATIEEFENYKQANISDFADAEEGDA